VCYVKCKTSYTGSSLKRCVMVSAKLVTLETVLKKVCHVKCKTSHIGSSFKKRCVMLSAKLVTLEAV
jgi:hypothetical protein